MAIIVEHSCANSLTKTFSTRSSALEIIKQAIQPLHGCQEYNLRQTLPTSSREPSHIPEPGHLGHYFAGQQSSSTATYKTLNRNTMILVFIELGQIVLGSK